MSTPKKPAPGADSTSHAGVSRGGELAGMYIGVIDTPYGQLSVNRGDAVDHASMVGGQLSGLLLLMMGDDGESFSLCNASAQMNLLWLAKRLADELLAVLPLVAADTAIGGAA